MPSVGSPHTDHVGGCNFFSSGVPRPFVVSCTQTLTRRVWGIRPEVLCISECVNCLRFDCVVVNVGTARQ